MNFTKHGMVECKAVEQQRIVYKLRMKIYKEVDKTNLSKIDDIIKAAMRSKSVMKVLCDFLIVIWNWTCEDKCY